MTYLMAKSTLRSSVLVVKLLGLVKITYFKVNFVKEFFFDVKFYTNPTIGEDSTLTSRGIFFQKMTLGVSKTQKHWRIL